MSDQTTTNYHGRLSWVECQGCGLPVTAEGRVPRRFCERCRTTHQVGVHEGFDRGMAAAAYLARGKGDRNLSILIRVQADLVRDGAMRDPVTRALSDLVEEIDAEGVRPGACDLMDAIAKAKAVLGEGE